VVVSVVNSRALGHTFPRMEKPVVAAAHPEIAGQEPTPFLSPQVNSRCVRFCQIALELTDDHADLT
jgi:hypothetical protein